MNDNTREGVIFGLSAFAVSCICVAAVIALIVAGVFISQAVSTSNAKHQGVLNDIQSKNYVHNYGYQQTQREAVSSDMNEVSQIGPQMVGQSAAEQQALGNQRINAIMTLCSDASKVDPSQGALPDAAFVSANCSGSVINTASPYETHPTSPTP